MANAEDGRSQEDSLRVFTFFNTRNLPETAKGLSIDRKQVRVPRLMKDKARWVDVSKLIASCSGYGNKDTSG